MNGFFVFALGIIVSLVGSNEAIDQDCNYSQTLTVGTTYYVYSPNYPAAYKGQRSCRWLAKSDYRVKLTCNAFEIPQSINCSLDVLAVQVAESVTHRYCGNGVFSTESVGRNMIVSFISSPASIGGRFFCELQAIAKSQEDDDCPCGWKKPTRIVGGAETGVNEYPMMAGLVDVTTRQVYCGATIIANRYLLTAAHCVTNRETAELAVLVGDHDISTGAETNATKLYRVANVQIHPSYSQVIEGNDIAVVAVQGTIDFGIDIGPACLPFQHEPDTFGGDYVELLGWGTVEYGGAKSNTLQKVSLSVLTPGKCSKSYPSITRAQLCTQGRGKDACQFDSGGPVLWQNPTSKRYVHIGTISYGGVCGGETPGVNTRTGAYIDWVTSVTPDAVYCMNE